MLLGFKTRLNLNQKQKTLMAQHAGYSRWVFNWALATRKRAYQEGLKPRTNQLKKLYTNYVKPQHPWMKTLSSKVYQYAFLDLQAAYKNFFEGRAKFPRFKKKNRDDSFTIDNSGKPIKLKGTKIKLPFIGWVKTYEPLPESETKKVTMSRFAGEWYISFAYEQSRNIPAKNNDTVGCDLGVKDLVVLSNTKVSPTLAPYRKLEKKISRLQYLNRKKTLGSSNCRKAQLKIARLHNKAANIRKNYLQKITSYIAKNFKRVVIENLNVSGMLANHSAISDQGFFEFRRQLEYKCSLYGTELIVADRWYPSSKTCSNCGTVKEKLSLSERRFECTHCKAILSRDLNAAINLSRYGEGYSVKACGLNSADTARMKQEVNIKVT